MNPTHPTRLSRTGLEIAQLWVTLDLGFWWYCRRWYRRCPIGWMSPILFSGAGDLNYFLFFFFFLITVFHFVLIMKFKINKKKKKRSPNRRCRGIGLKSSLSIYILDLGPNSRSWSYLRRSKHCQGSPY